MIIPSAIKKFLNAPRDDWRAWREYPPAKLERLMKQLPVSPPIWHKLRLHQKVCFLLGVKTRRFAFHADTGTGKTLLSIALSRYFLKMGGVKRVLVLVPNRVNKYEWAREIKKHSTTTTFAILHGSTPAKWKQLEGTQTQMVVETYAGFVRMCCLMEKRKRGKGQRLRPDPKLVKRVFAQFEGIVCDEVTHAKNKKSLAYRVLRRLSPKMQFFFTLTGTPLGRDPTDLWAQMDLVDQGQSLGPTLGLFRAAFFTSKKNFWGGFEYTFKRSMAGKLNDLIAHRSIRIEADKADLPRVVSISKYITLPTDADAFYERLKKQLIESRGNYREMKNVFLRMRQISSGFIGFYDDEVGTKAEVEFQPNRKLDMLMSLLENLNPEDKAIVFHEFIHSGDLICKRLTASKIKWVRIKGGSKSENALTEFERPGVRVLVLSNSAGGYGLNLQAASYGFFYESPVSPRMRKQTRARFVRQYSKHARVFEYDLIVKGTMDERILEFHAEGRDLFEAIVDGTM